MSRSSAESDKFWSDVAEAYEALSIHKGIGLRVERGDKRAILTYEPYNDHVKITVTQLGGKEAASNVTKIHTHGGISDKSPRTSA
jgi:hypothetical protein